MALCSVVAPAKVIPWASNSNKYQRMATPVIDSQVVAFHTDQLMYRVGSSESLQIH